MLLKNSLFHKETIDSLHPRKEKQLGKNRQVMISEVRNATLIGSLVHMHYGLVSWDHRPFLPGSPCQALASSNPKRALALRMI